MKSITGVLVILLLSQSVVCSPKKINTDFLNLLSSKTNVMSSQDAIQSVLTLLEDLQGANVEAQDKADQHSRDLNKLSYIERQSLFPKILNKRKQIIIQSHNKFVYFLKKQKLVHLLQFKIQKIIYMKAITKL